MARVLAIANQKGGVGKTTTAVNLAASLAVAERRTLLVDCDPQGNASSGLGLSREGIDKHLYQLLINETHASEAIHGTDLAYLHLIPARTELIGAEIELQGLPGREKVLLERLRPLLGHYDYILLDCPPSLGQLTRAALSASSKVYIPIQCEYFAMEGLSQIIELARQTKSRDNHRLEIGGILLTMFDPALELANEVADEVRVYFAKTVFESLIPRDVAISEAPSHGLSVLEYAPRSRGARAYAELVLEVIDRE